MTRQTSDREFPETASRLDRPVAHAAAATSEQVDDNRRSFLGTIALGAALTQLGIAKARGQTLDAPGAGPSGAGRAGRTSFTSLKQVKAGELDIGYAEAGPVDGPPVLLLHGWPYDIHSYVDVAPMLAQAGFRVIVPYLRGYGSTRFLSAQALRNGQQAALGVDAIALMDALRIEKAVIGGYDWGARTANIVAALWPERCKAMVSVSGYLIGSQELNKAPLPPKAELQWWYQFYFATARGEAGYAKYTHDFARLIWQLASPEWRFDEATFARSAAAFDNPDHVAVSIHNYRWRLGLAQGEARFDAIEQKLATLPTIAVPTITMEGDANGAPHPEPAAYAKRFTGRYEHRLIKGGIGHNLPQEAPQAFAQAIIDVARF
ncbi:alpha/beta hydrolase [Bosea sp. BK604]|uniref:alpha/beta fold hydrolase n=1 Tax=Bosea sp. BK604 TaxID=2512180 RepID=UPI00104C6BAA|nr:alpha/beta hydrolase [Bosea sp. BK604]TCR63036.1 pimeloyl-ACP methyl ester carboxylesterase [Bosea sp. BK604]